MELFKSITYRAVLLFLWNTTTKGGILYPTDGHTAVANALINPADTIIGMTGRKMFGVEYIQAYVDKKGGLYTTVPSSPKIYIHTWLNSELSFVQHPTGKLLLGYIEDDTDLLLTRASNDVKSAFGVDTFSATDIYVMTYANFTPDGTAAPPMNTFQMILISDAETTYMELNYPIEEMGWWKDSSGRYPAVTVTYEDEAVIMLPESGTAKIQEVLLKGNTPNVPGRWMFRIDGQCPVCVHEKGGYLLSCVDGDLTKCMCSSCDADPLFEGGLTQAQKNLIISTSVVGGLALIGTTAGLAVYFKKYHKRH